MINSNLSSALTERGETAQPLCDVISTFVSLNRSNEAFSLPAANDPKYEPTVRNLQAIAYHIRTLRRARTNH